MSSSPHCAAVCPEPARLGCITPGKMGSYKQSPPGKDVPLLTRLTCSPNHPPWLTVPVSLYRSDMFPWQPESWAPAASALATCYYFISQV